MLVSLGYAAQSASRQRSPDEYTEGMTRQDLRLWSRFWYSHVSAAFVRGYWAVAKSGPYMPPSLKDQETLLGTYLLERALLDDGEDLN